MFFSHCANFSINIFLRNVVFFCAGANGLERFIETLFKFLFFIWQADF